MKMRYLLAALVLTFCVPSSEADSTYRYSVLKVEVQDGVPIYNPNSTGRTVARVRLKQGSATEKSVWFEIDDAAGYGKVKLGLFLSAVTSGRPVEISTATDKGWMNWAIDPLWTTAVSEYCYLVGVIP